MLAEGLWVIENGASVMRMGYEAFEKEFLRKRKLIEHHLKELPFGWQWTKKNIHVKRMWKAYSRILEAQLPNRRILDLGSGDCVLDSILKDRGYEVVAVDP